MVYEKRRIVFFFFFDNRRIGFPLFGKKVNGRELGSGHE